MGRTFVSRLLAISNLLLVAIGSSPAQESAVRKAMAIPEDFPRFVVPGYEP